MTYYRWNFRESKDDAIKYAKEHGGAVYTNLKYSKTKRDYLITCSMAGHYGDEEWYKKYPAVVCWNEQI